MDNGRDEILLQRVLLEIQTTRAEMNERFDLIESRRNEDRAEDREWRKSAAEAISGLGRSIEIVHNEVQVVSRQVDELQDDLHRHIVDEHSAKP
jgi:hypothetical protein